MLEKLFSQLAGWGYQGRVVPIQHLGDLQREIEGHYRQGLFDQELYQTYLADFAFTPPGTLPGTRSIIVVAIPQPQIQVMFTWDGEPIHYVIPPTYPERKMDKHVREFVGQILEPMGYQVATAVLPKKLLAVRSGLAAYGKNNITYVPGMGSFLGLVTLYSDLPTPEGDWREPQMMENCRDCSACRRHCPAGAITSERFLLHAERCITFHNEKPGDVPFSAGIDPAWHNCLVGCLHCQRVCPQNKETWLWIEKKAQFSEEETALLLEGLSLEQLPAAIVAKLEQSALVDYADLLPRNLGALLGQRR